MRTRRATAAVTAGTASRPYADLFGLLLPLQAPERSCAAKVLDMAEIETGTRLLDVGCGGGHLLSLAAHTEPGAILVGVDPDVDAIELARRKLRSAPARVFVYRGSAQALPLVDEFFDVVTCNFVLARMAESIRMESLRECFRVLRPGGRLIVADWRTLDTLLPGALQPLLATLHHLAGRMRSSGRTAIEAMQRAGLECVEPARTLATWAGIVDVVHGDKPEC